MARVAVTDPDGVEWRVWRRWYAWRRWLTLRDVWNAVPSGGNDIEDLIALPLVLLGLVASLLDLAVQLVALPFVLLARLVRLAAWPVQVDREDKHVRTVRVKGFAAAAALRDAQVAQVREGSLLLGG